MSRPSITIHNLDTDEVVTREMNDEEFAQYELDQANAQARIAAEAAKEAARISRREKLLALGLTEEELDA